MQLRQRLHRWEQISYKGHRRLINRTSHSAGRIGQTRERQVLEPYPTRSSEISLEMSTGLLF